MSRSRHYVTRMLRHGRSESNRGWGYESYQTPAGKRWAKSHRARCDRRARKAEAAMEVADWTEGTDPDNGQDVSDLYTESQNWEWFNNPSENEQYYDDYEEQYYFEDFENDQDYDDYDDYEERYHFKDDDYYDFGRYSDPFDPFYDFSNPMTNRAAAFTEMEEESRYYLDLEEARSNYQDNQNLEWFLSGKHLEEGYEEDDEPFEPFWGYVSEEPTSWEDYLPTLEDWHFRKSA